MVEVTGLEPLAARPGAQPTGLCSLLSRFLFQAPLRKPLSPVRASTLKSRQNAETTKKDPSLNTMGLFCKQWVILICLKNGFNFEVMGSMKYPKHSILLLFN